MKLLVLFLTSSFVHIMADEDEEYTEYPVDFQVGILKQHVMVVCLFVVVVYLFTSLLPSGSFLCPEGPVEDSPQEKQEATPEVS